MGVTEGQRAPRFDAEDIRGETITLERYRGAPVLLMFFRYASCPMCNLRLHDFAEAYGGLERHGLKAIAFFHSDRRSIVRHAGARNLPFPLIADPGEAIYRRYGVARSWWGLFRSTLLPRFYVDWARAVRYGFWGGAVGRMHTMPADFLIDRNGLVVRAHYGRDIGDHLSLAAIGDVLKRD